MSGQLIGNRYRVLRKIGEGGMAVVHLAVDEKLGRDVAIKILRERYENHDEIRTRFQHEARAISSFDHPNILKVYDFSGEDSRQLWIVTELIHGRNLAQILETTPSGWLHPIIAASIVREICRALASAHEHGVVHRDVKPENVMITHHGVVKLMDFGIAKIQKITSMTQTGIFMGSPSYMSPEQVRGRDVDNRSDIYSLGVLFYELVSGKLPFTGSSTADIAMRILNGDFAHPRFIMAGLPDSLDQCIVQCMALQPENRPPSIDYVGEKIDSLLQSMGLETSMQELERCFKDPKAYGDRLSKILKVSEAKQDPTVLISEPTSRDIAKWNSQAINSPIPRPDVGSGAFAAGTPRRDHLLPPRSVPHFTKRQLSPELISAHLPERRHQQRVLEATRLASGSKFGQYPKKNASPPPRNPAYDYPQQGYKPDAQNHRPKSPGAELGKARDIRPVSRMVPPMPRRNPRPVRYVVNETYHPHSQSGIFTKFVIVLLLISSAFIIWLGNTRDFDNKKHSASVSQKNKKTQTKPITKSTPSVANEITRPNASSTNLPKAVDVVKIEKKTTVEPLPKYAEKTKIQEKPLQPQRALKEPRQTDDGRMLTQKNLSPSSKDLPKEIAPKLIRESNKIPSTTERSQVQGPQYTNPKLNVSEIASTKVDTPKIDLAGSRKPIEEDDQTTSQSIVTPSKPVNKSDAQTTKLKQVQVSISSTPAAELFVNGRRFGTTNNNGSSSDWIDLTPGAQRIELRRSGFAIRRETIVVNTEPKQRFGPYTLTRGDTSSQSKPTYRLTLSTNLPPVEVTIHNIDTNAKQTISMTQTTRTIPLERGIYEVTMNRNGDIRKRKLDFSGAAQQLTFSVDFKDTSN